MKIQVDLDYLEPGETIYFTVDRIMQLEQLTKKSISEIVNQSFSMNDLVACLLVGTRHYRTKKNGMRQGAFFIGKIQAALGEGSSFDELTEPVVKALVGSGILGKKAVYAMFPELALDEMEEEVDEALASKNETPIQED